MAPLQVRLLGIIAAELDQQKVIKVINNLQMIIKTARKWTYFSHRSL